MLWSDMKRNATEIVIRISKGEDWSKVVNEYGKIRLPSERNQDLIYVTSKAMLVPLPDNAAFRECNRSERLVQKILLGNPKKQ